MITTPIQKVEPEVSSWEVKDLYNALAKLDTNRQVMMFLRDLCTIAEIQEMSRRWQIVLRLQKGLPYLEIAKQTGASTATITRVAHWLHHGTGGYRMMLEEFGRPLKEKS